MTALDLAQAPPPARPLRWLLAAPLWGLVAGVGVLLGEDAFVSRWAPPTVALVHVFTLGVLGNAMLGSLLQFLPVAAGVPMPLRRSAAWLHAAFTLGLALFVTGLLAPSPRLLGIAAVLLAGPPLAFAAAALPGLLRRGAARALRGGIALSLCALAVTVCAGGLLVATLRGDLSLTLPRLADVHAATGLLGWVLVLMAAVGSVVLPMFQGTVGIAPRRLACWCVAAGVALVVGAVLHLAFDAQAGLAIAASLPALAFVAVSLWLPARAPRRRNPALVGFWRCGTLALGLGCALAPFVAAGALPPSTGLFAGALGLGVGLPMMLSGMLLEIVAFLAWLGLRDAGPRGVRVPGTGQLLPERWKAAALGAHLLCTAALPAAALWPASARVAGLALLAAHGATLACALRGLLHARRFARVAARTA
ncbi:hypothetical protein [Luteimonas sp. FCS-9]|uniref:hypothetical protein n=1 Tax=Luteimonas sp. FCS-9 TaxID=1547516 RepID=UPI00063EB65E|nr:hypothetical protein [Luteimonas sp. FCS-9]KLJ02037.1 hypothetical protein WQ56_04115 [Luteimonas sp. FCS-9]